MFTVDVKQQCNATLSNQTSSYIRKHNRMLCARWEDLDHFCLHLQSESTLKRKNSISFGKMISRLHGRHFGRASPVGEANRKSSKLFLFVQMAEIHKTIFHFVTVATD